MSTISQSYDHPTYTVREGQAMGEVGGGATTAYAKFNAFTDMKAYSVVFTVTTAGLASNNTMTCNQISGATTTALATATLGTQIAGNVVVLNLSTGSGGVSLLQGDVLELVSGADTTGKALATYEVKVKAGANITK